MPVCECCGEEGATKAYSRCKESRYCSKECQTKHWKAGHKHKCVKKAVEPSAACRRAAFMHSQQHTYLGPVQSSAPLVIILI